MMSQSNQETKEEKNHFIGNYTQAAHFGKGNQFINRGYRINFNTPKKIFKSLFMMHNETMNIWIHLLGAIIVLFFLVYFLLTYSSENSKESFKLLIKEKFDSHVNNVNFIGLTPQKVSDMTAAIKLKYYEFGNLTVQKMNLANQTLNKIIQQTQKLFEQSLLKFINIKQKFENQGAQSMIDTLDSLGQNQTVIQDFKLTLKQFGNKFIMNVDSSSYDFLDLTRTANPGNISRWPVVAMMISAIICLMCSAIYHLFYPMSTNFFLIFRRFDYAGINILISGSTIPSLYYGLYCHPGLAQFYIVCISIIAITLFIFSLFQFMHTERFRKVKSICYGSFGIAVSVPLFHMIINEIFFEDGDEFTFLNSLPLFLGLGASYLGGLVLYTQRCPQRHSPGSFDICGHSHQIWHLTVILGIVFTYLASLQNFQERKKYPYCIL